MAEVVLGEDAAVVGRGVAEDVGGGGSVGHGGGWWIPAGQPAVEL